MSETAELFTRKTAMGSHQQEGPALNKVRNAERTYAAFRWGNVVGVRGHQLREKMEV